MKASDGRLVENWLQVDMLGLLVSSVSHHHSPRKSRSHEPGPAVAG
jgi:hypothetical protein